MNVNINKQLCQSFLQQHNSIYCEHRQSLINNLKSVLTQSRNVTVQSRCLIYGCLLDQRVFFFQ